MKLWISLTLLMLTACGCSSSAKQSHTSSGPQRIFVPISKPHDTGYDLRFSNNQLLFCDSLGGHTVDLQNGKSSAAQISCRQPPEEDSSLGNYTCDNVVANGYPLSVSSPEDRSEDDVHVGLATFTMPGRVHDCVSVGNFVAISTGVGVRVFNPAMNRVWDPGALSAYLIAMSQNWIAWTNPYGVHAVPRSLMKPTKHVDAIADYLKKNPDVVKELNQLPTKK